MSYEIDPINIPVSHKLQSDAETLAYIETLQEIIRQLTQAVEDLDDRVAGLGG